MDIGRKSKFLRDKRSSAYTEAPVNSTFTPWASSLGNQTAKAFLPGQKTKKPDTRDGSREARTLVSSSELPEEYGQN